MASNPEENQLDVELVPLVQLHPHPRNPRRIRDERMKDLTAAIAKDPSMLWARPVIALPDGTIICGEKRWRAAQNLNWTSIPTVYADLDTETAYRWMLRDNQEYGQWEEEATAQLLLELQQAQQDLSLTGFEQREIDRLLQLLEKNQGKPGPDDVPSEPKAPRSAQGELWLLGDHRLIIGDATDTDTVARLMEEKKADLIFTDPPYGVDYANLVEARKSAGLGQKKEGWEDIQSDELTNDQLAGFLIAAFKQMALHSTETAAFYIWHASVTREDYAFAMKACGLQERQYLIWAKPHFVTGTADYQWAHEPCFYAAKIGHVPSYYGDRGQSTVWRVGYSTNEALATVIGPGITILDGRGGMLYITSKPPKSKKLRTIRLESAQALTLYDESTQATLWEVAREAKAEHPTQKPVELARRAIVNSTRSGQIVLDLYRTVSDGPR